MGRASISYSNKDYESLRQELLSRIPQLTDRWTDFNESDLGVVLLELFCGVGDMLAYYLDVQAAEAFLPTARQRQNVINLCKLINYRLDTPVAATTTLRFSLSSVLDSDLTIPAGIVCKARLEDGDVDFETVDDVVLARGGLSVDVGTRQGTRRSEEFTGTGDRNQRFALSSTSIAQGSVRVKVGDSGWEEARFFIDSGPDSKHFQVEADGLDVTCIIFGDGIHSAFPLAGETITVEYLETLGSKGNIGRNLVTEIVTPVYHNGALVQLFVTNPIASTGGSDHETLDHAKLQAPAELRSLWKAVTKSDYKALAEGFPGVAKAQVLDANDCANIRYYQVNMAVAPDGGGLPSPTLKRELAEFIESRKVITIEVNLFDPCYRPVYVDAEVYVYPTEDNDSVRRRIEAALQAFFSFDRLVFGQPIYFSDIVSLLDGIQGVSHVTMFSPQADIEIKPGQIATLGEIHLGMKVAAL
ncbi:MAG TPA: baseplate J/gp47 family protein [Armatimonadota bacterium]|nr:baseplate J/gp47 family protein [Armatimonadota bacterium]